MQYGNNSAETTLAEEGQSQVVSSEHIHNIDDLGGDLSNRNNARQKLEE